MQTIRLALIGGFLGAGKTTLLAEAAQRLSARGERVATITNDQAEGLVDSATLARAGFPVDEVAGSCFCCDFNGFYSAAEHLIAAAEPTVILAEPVGSCTDLAATVLRPLRERHGERFRVGPYTVLVDPFRLLEADPTRQQSAFPESVLYIFKKQLEEADGIVVNKTDLLSDADRAAVDRLLDTQFAELSRHYVSALEGDGVDAWLDHVLTGEPGGTRVIDVDYDTYAEGEAELGWLNAEASVLARVEIPPEAFCVAFLTAVVGEMQREGGEIAHLKLSLECEGGYLHAHLTGIGHGPVVEEEGEPRLGPASPGRLLVNARVGIAPEVLERMVRGALLSAAGRTADVNVQTLRSFRPARPVPTYRS